MGDTIVRLAILVGKMVAFVLFFMLIRWTIPRFRFDQLMNLAWKVMIPLALLNLLGGMIVRQFGWSPWVMTAVSAILFVGAGVWGLLTQNSITTPRRKIVKLPPGIPAGVTYASR